MSEPLDIKQTVQETEYAATSASGDAIITITNYYYREQPQTVYAESADISVNENLPCPYRGLFHFGPENAEFFFGRDVFVQELLKSTQTRRFIPILGASGSGKSSVVFAGLVPHLQTQGQWKFTHFRPGADPFHALSLALVPLYAPHLDVTDHIIHARKLANHFRDGTVPISDIFAQIQHNYPNYRVLLIADQFEELYTLCDDEVIRRSFLDKLLTNFQTPTNKSPPLTTLVATIRADFLGNALSYRPFADMLQNADIKLGSMNREELSQVIEKPAVKLGVKFEAGLVARILNDVEHEPGNLPLLEFALTLLWERRTGKQLTHADYQAIGEVKGALASHADEKYQQISSEQQEQVRRIFIQLVHPGEGTEDTRRVATKSELGEAKWSLVKILADARLVVTSRNAANQETVEVVHEALIQNWSELRQWMSTDRHFRAWQDRLRAAMHQWKEANQDDGALLRGVPLVEAENWLNKRSEDLSQGEQDFIQTSLVLRDQEKKEREHRRRSLMSGLMGFSAVALSLAGFAMWQWQQSEIAQLNTLIQSAKLLITSNKQLDTVTSSLIASNEQLDTVTSSLIASHEQLEAVETTLTAAKKLKWMFWGEANKQDEILILLQQAIYQIREKNRLEGHTNSINSVSYSQDGKMLASASADKTIKLWDAATGKLLKTLSGHQDIIFGVSFSPDGKRLASASRDQRAIIWDVATGQPLHTLFGHKNYVKNVAFSPDGTMLASGGSDNMIKLWDVATGQPLRDLSGHTKTIKSLSFSPDGRMLASGSSDRSVKLWNVATGQLLRTLSHSASVTRVRFIQDGQKLASVSTDNTLKLWDVATGTIVKSFPMHHSSLEENDVGFSEDMRILASASKDNTIKIWDITKKQLLYTLPGHPSKVNQVSFSPDGKTLASASDDQTIKLWDIATVKPFKTLTGHNKGVFSVSFSPDGKILASGSRQGEIRLWNVTTGQGLNTLTEHKDTVFNVNFSADGKMLASASADKTVKLWDTKTGKLLKTLPEQNEFVKFANFSRDGKIVISGSNDQTVKLWDTKTGQLIKPLSVLSGKLLSIKLSPDRTILACASDDKTIRFWDIATGQQLQPIKDSTGIVDISFSPDGKKLASSGEEDEGKTIKLWDIATGKQLKTLKSHSAMVYKISFNPQNGNELASTSDDKTIKLWDVSTGRELATLAEHSNRVRNVSFSPDGNTLASASEDGTIILWDLTNDVWYLDFNHLMRRNCDRVRGYLQNNPNVSQQNRHLCDQIPTE
ncbi:MAG TPA: WD40 repeat domain-containing protein [Nostocaceae cyanobacterium]|nr:WD40 repeat domain-containing protein [Nostocaceae cyanobacterium]